jgi:hypothetical protein
LWRTNAVVADYFTQRYILAAAAAAVCFDLIEAICARRINLLTPSMGLNADVHWQQSRDPECEELIPQAHPLAEQALLCILHRCFQ